MTVTHTLPPVITNCFSTEILPSFFPEIINRIVDCYSLRCVFCYSVHSFGYPLFNFSLLSLRNELVAIALEYVGNVPAVFRCQLRIALQHEQKPYAARTRYRYHALDILEFRQVCKLV